MSEEIASLERVTTAVHHLRTRGVKVTAGKVLELTGGSKTTVLRHLQELRRQTADERTVPPAVLEMAKGALTDVYEAGRREGEERSRAVIERASLMVAELEEQVEELIRDGATMAQAIDDLRTQLTRSDDALANARAAHAEAEKRSAELQDRLLEEQGRSVDRVAEAIGKIDAIIALSELDSMMPSLPSRRPRATSKKDPGDEGS